MTVQDIAHIYRNAWDGIIRWGNLWASWKQIRSGLGVLTAYGTILWNMKTDCTCIAGMALTPSCNRRSYQGRGILQ